MDMNVVFPDTLECEAMAIRGMYVAYNHLSDLSKTYDTPKIFIPQHFRNGNLMKNLY